MNFEEIKKFLSKIKEIDLTNKSKIYLTASLVWIILSVILLGGMVSKVLL